MKQNVKHLVFFHKYSQGEVQIHKYTIYKYTINKCTNTDKVRYKYEFHKYTNTHKVRFSSGGRRSATSSCCQLVDLGGKKLVKIFLLETLVGRSFKRLLKLGDELLRTSKEINFRTHVLDVDFSFPLVLFWDLVNIKWPFDRNHDHSHELPHPH